MGLDQTFKVISNITEEILYERDLRKVNCVQGYFERKYEIDNLDEINISKEDIDYLFTHAKHILENKEDIEYCMKNLPIQLGFFYGNYEYNDYYIEDVKETFDCANEMLEIIKSNNIDDLSISYWCWY